MSIRAFIAVELPTEVRGSLGLLARELAASGADVKWVEEANLHVTMRFLGEITEEQRQGLATLLTAVAARRQPIPLRLSSLGGFPSLTSPRVVWVGVGQGHEELAAIAGDVEEGLARLGLPHEERAFIAHVTLGRVRSGRNLGRLVSQITATTWTPPEPFVADQLTLFQSTLSSSGPIYTALATLPFKQPS